MSRIPIQFPLKGVTENTAFSKLGVGSSFNSQNVVPFDGSERLRGAQRKGLSKVLSSAVDGSGAAIQRLVQGTVSTPPGLEVSDGFNYSDGDISAVTSTWDDVRVSGGNWVTGTNLFRVTSNTAVHDRSADNQFVFAVRDEDLVDTDNYSVSATVTVDGTGSPNYVFGGVLLESNWPTTPAGGLMVGLRVTGATTGESACWRLNGINTPQIIDDDNLPSGIVVGNAITNANFRVVVSRTASNEKQILAYVDGTLVGSFPVSNETNLGQKVGLAAYRPLNATTGDNPITLDNFTFAGDTFSSRQTKLVVVTGGTVYVSGSPPTTLTQATGGESVLDASTFFMGAVTGPPSPSDSSPENTQRYVYMCDGSSYRRLNLDTDTVTTWSAASGTLPEDSVGNKAKIIALYRNRIVLAGLPEEPQNWFMSASGDPRDFNYSPSTPSAIQAVAGNNSDAGQIGDIITALIPYGDDTLLFGGDRTMWRLSGDPAEGGRIDNISYEAGVVGADAWARDTFGNTYFMSTNGLMRMSPGSRVPETVSAGRLDRTFRAINRATTRVLLAWDRDLEGLYIFLTPTAQPTAAPAAYWYDARTDSFWPLRYPVASGPTASLVFDGDSPTDRTLMLGGWDSFIREVDSSKNSDADTSGDVAISSFVDIGPVHSNSASERLMLSDLRCVLSSDSSPVQFQAYAGQSVEQAVNTTTPRWARTLTAGMNSFVQNRVAGAAVRLRMAQNTLDSTWAFEQGDMLVTKLGRQRRLGR